MYWCLSMSSSRGVTDTPSPSYKCELSDGHAKPLLQVVYKFVTYTRCLHVVHKFEVIHDPSISTT
jgi:hypothetical protein